MEGELGSGARIAIALIVIGVIISVIFVILGFTRGTTNQGISGVSTSMDAMTLARFDDYDQKTISGTQVIAAVKLFEGQPVATVVRTLATMNATVADPDGNATGQNYGAILDGSTRSGEVFNTAAIVRASGNTDSFYTYNLETNNGALLAPNMIYTPMTDPGTSTFVRPTARFLAEQIRDSTGTIVGIVFTQQL